MDWRDYWAKAKENLEMASFAFQRKKHNVCASRAYYAVFLASYKPRSVSATEAKRAYDRAKNFLGSIGQALKESA